jgi:ubiquinone/menaquinone biosynthesis C-methylase UbiE
MSLDLEAHSRVSSNYRKHTTANPLQRLLIARFHRRIVGEVAALSPRTFLDAGCGEGFVALQIAQAIPGVEITGCDVSAGALAVATGALPNARFVPGSVTELPFADRAFDVVGCFEVLEHLPGDLPRQALRELARVARRSVVLSVPHEPAFSLANAARGKNLDVRPRGSDPDHKQFWSRRAFGELVGDTLRVRALRGSLPWTICVADVGER